MNVESIYNQALSLSEFERIELADLLLSSVESTELEAIRNAWIDEIDPIRREAWVREAKRRLEAYDRGEMKAYSREEVMAKFRRGQHE